MKARPQSLRAALLVLGSIAVAAASNGCSSTPGSEETSQSGQDLTNRPPVSILSATSAPVGSDAACGSYTVPVPAALEGHGCTLGVAIKDDPKLPSSSQFPSGTQAYAWACSDALNTTAGTEALASAVKDSDFGGPEGATTIAVNTASTTADGCFGAAKPGYTVVVEYVPNYICIPPRRGVVAPLVTVCRTDDCNCPVGYAKTFLQ